MKLLVTGFEPFGGESINASWEAVQALPDQVGPWELVKICLPVEFGRAAEIALAKVELFSADAVVCVGQAAGRSEITPELLGINLRHAGIPDNGGFQPQYAPVALDGPAAYFSTLPVHQMTQAISARGIPAKLSYSAGAYVCNDILYLLLHHLASSSVRAGFVHLPPTPSQVTQGQPSMTTENCVQALIAAIEAI